MIRTKVFKTLDIAANGDFVKLNDRSYGILLEDANGHERLARVAVIVAEEREDMMAHELMENEIEDYNAKQRAKAERKAQREAKAKQDAEKRAKIAAERAAKAAEAAANA